MNRRSKKRSQLPLGVVAATVLLALPAAAQQKEPQRPSQPAVLDRFSNEPSVREVQEVAMQYAVVSDKTLNSYQRAGRWTKVLPRTRVRYGGGDSDDVAITVNADGERTARLDRDADNDFDVYLEWRLDEFMMGPTRIQTIRETSRLVQLRDDILDEVTKIYFDRRRLQVDLLMSPQQDPRSRVTKDLRLEELTANLDALTGGWFSQRVRAGSQPRSN